VIQQSYRMEALPGSKPHLFSVRISSAESVYSESRGESGRSSVTMTSSQSINERSR
jgi:hypothetical protein